MVLLAAILSSILDIASLTIALVRARLPSIFVLHFSFSTGGFNLGAMEHFALFLSEI